MHRFRTLVVVTPAQWLADDFGAAAPSGLRVQWEIGFDLPDLAREEVLWWCPGSYAARAGATGRTLPLTSAGPGWLPSLPMAWRRRRVEAMTFAEATAAGIPDGWFAKAAEIKVAALPARTYAAGGDFLLAAADAGLEPESWLTVSEPVAYAAEYRCFAAHGRVTAASPYLVAGTTWDGMPPSAAASPETAEAAAFAQSLLDDVGVEACPPGFAIDVGRMSDGGWSVIEANASWSSNPYHADLRGVIASIAAAHDPQGEYPQWAWRIDPYHRRRARPLPLRAAARG